MIQSLAELNTPRIRLYLDTADATQWQSWLPTGLFYGVTTNPLLLEQAQVACSVERLKDLARQALSLGAKEVQLQTWGTSVEALVKTGKLLAAIDDRIVVKVPITQVGTQAASRLIADGIRTTLTGVYAVHQVLIAAALGADYAAPYLGRINDLGRNGREDLVAMQKAIAGVGSATRILVASIRSIDDITYLATQGLDTFTFREAIAQAFFDVAATNQAAADFEQAAARMGVQG
ncbi:MAG: transaldolase family protein [Cyanobacteriota bacterium]